MTTLLKYAAAAHLAVSFVLEQLLINAFSARLVNFSTKERATLHALLLVLSNTSLKESALLLVQAALSSQMHQPVHPAIRHVRPVTAL